MNWSYKGHFNPPHNIYLNIPISGQGGSTPGNVRSSDCNILCSPSSPLSDKRWPHFIEIDKTNLFAPSKGHVSWLIPLLSTYSHLKTRIHSAVVCFSNRGKKPVPLLPPSFVMWQSQPAEASDRGSGTPQPASPAVHLIVGGGPCFYYNSLSSHCQPMLSNSEYNLHVLSFIEYWSVRNRSL